jgi:FkbM family methyltransferase
VRGSDSPGRVEVVRLLKCSLPRIPIQALSSGRLFSLYTLIAEREKAAAMSSPLGSGPSPSTHSSALRLSSSRLSRFAKMLAPALSRAATSPLLLKLSRYAEAYMNILLGKGSGTGWDLSGEIRAACSTFHSRDPFVLDVGANQGDWSRMLLAKVPGARITMFEPAQGCQTHLQPLVGDRVKLVPFAVGAALGTAELWSSSETDGAASLHPRKDTYFATAQFRPQQVEVTSIDHYLSHNGPERVDFMKLDIEGHELAALQGAETSLSQGKIRALAFEFGAANLNSRTFFRDFWDYLRLRNFDLLRITPGGRLLAVPDYSEDLEYFRGVTNYLAVCARPIAAS